MGLITMMSANNRFAKPWQIHQEENSDLDDIMMRNDAVTLESILPLHDEITFDEILNAYARSVACNSLKTALVLLENYPEILDHLQSDAMYGQDHHPVTMLSSIRTLEILKLSQVFDADKVQKFEIFLKQKMLDYQSRMTALSLNKDEALKLPPDLLLNLSQNILNSSNLIDVYQNFPQHHHYIPKLISLCKFSDDQLVELLDQMNDVMSRDETIDFCAKYKDFLIDSVAKLKAIARILPAGDRLSFMTTQIGFDHFNQIVDSTSERNTLLVIFSGNKAAIDEFNLLRKAHNLGLSFDSIHKWKLPDFKKIITDDDAFMVALNILSNDESGDANLFGANLGALISKYPNSGSPDLKVKVDEIFSQLELKSEEPDSGKSAETSQDSPPGNNFISDFAKSLDAIPISERAGYLKSIAEGKPYEYFNSRDLGVIYSKLDEAGVKDMLFGDAADSDQPITFVPHIPFSKQPIQSLLGFLEAAKFNFDLNFAVVHHYREFLADASSEELMRLSDLLPSLSTVDNKLKKQFIHVLPDEGLDIFVKPIVPYIENITEMIPVIFPITNQEKRTEYFAMIKDAIYEQVTDYESFVRVMRCLSDKDRIEAWEKFIPMADQKITADDYINLASCFPPEHFVDFISLYDELDDYNEVDAGYLYDLLEALPEENRVSMFANVLQHYFTPLLSVTSGAADYIDSFVELMPKESQASVRSVLNVFWGLTNDKINELFGNEATPMGQHKTLLNLNSSEERYYRLQRYVEKESNNSQKLYRRLDREFGKDNFMELKLQTISQHKKLSL